MSYVVIPVTDTKDLYRVVTLLPVGVDNVRMTPGADVYKPFENHGALAAQGDNEIKDNQIVAIDAPQAPWLEKNARSDADAAHYYTAINAVRYVSYLNGGSITDDFPEYKNEKTDNARAYRKEEERLIEQKKREDEKKSK